MNTKPIPAVLALIAGFVTCIMSFVQGIDVVVFAKRFVFVCLIFYVIGTVICIVINMNFKEMANEDEQDESSTEDESKDEDEQDESPTEDESEDEDEQDDNVDMTKDDEA